MRWNQQRDVAAILLSVIYIYSSDFVSSDACRRDTMPGSHHRGSPRRCTLSASLLKISASLSMKRPF